MHRFPAKIPTAVLLTALSVVFNAEPAMAEWTNSEFVDEITNDKVVLTCQTSSNKLDFAFPYEGGSIGKICIKKSKTDGLEIFLRITKGQILCSSYFTCALQARFDDKPPIRLSGSGTESLRTDMMFLNPAARIANELRRSKVFKIGVTFFQSGTQVLEFDTSTYKALP